MTSKEYLVSLFQQTGLDLLSACELAEKYLVEFRQRLQENPGETLVYHITIGNTVKTIHVTAK
jgi:hypothetical protein